MHACDEWRLVIPGVNQRRDTLLAILCPVLSDIHSQSRERVSERGRERKREREGRRERKRGCSHKFRSIVLSLCLAFLEFLFSRSSLLVSRSPRNLLHKRLPACVARDDCWRHSVTRVTSPCDGSSSHRSIPSWRLASLDCEMQIPVS